MNTSRLRKSVFLVFSTVTLFMFLFGSPVKADGGPIVPDSVLWSDLSESQQIAVVQLNSDDSATIHLFITMVDGSGQSHEITYFLPLGNSPSNFQAIEESSLDFDMKLTDRLDNFLVNEAEHTNYSELAQLAGPLVNHGFWLLPVLAPLALSGCSAGSNVPESSINTPSSQIDIYGLDTETDITELITISGLDSSVQDTLEKLRGQKIAVVKVKTQPVTASQTNLGYQNVSFPGLHFSWNSPLGIEADSGNRTLTYPLGTGSSWAKPIELTRVYITSPRSTVFDVQYPELGQEYSGISIGLLGHSNEIMNHIREQAYAVEKAADNEQQVWRITYTQSNPAEDIQIMVDRTGGLTGWLKQTFPLHLPFGYIILFSILIALLLWVVAWRYIMKPRLGIEYTWKGSRLWKDALVYPGINTGMVIVSIPLIIVSFFLGPLVIFTAILAVAAILAVPTWIYILKFRRITGQSKTRLILSYLMVVLAANLVYTGGCILVDLVGIM